MLLLAPPKPISSENSSVAVDAVPQDEVPVLDVGDPVEALGDVRARREHDPLVVGQQVEGIDVFQDRVGECGEDERPRIEIHGVDRAHERPRRRVPLLKPASTLNETITSPASTGGGSSSETPKQMLSTPSAWLVDEWSTIRVMTSLSEDTPQKLPAFVQGAVVEPSRPLVP